MQLRRYCPVCEEYHFASPEAWDELLRTGVCRIPKVRRKEK